MSFDPAKTEAAAWQIALQGLITERMQMPFAWGSHDCCLWAADAVLAQTGIDPAANERGTYFDVDGAARLLRELGGLSEVGRRAGPEIPPLMAQFGDIGLMQIDGRQMLGVCAGQVWLAPGIERMSAAPLESAVQAWRVNRG